MRYQRQRVNFLRKTGILLFVLCFSFLSSGLAQKHIRILNWNDFHAKNTAIHKKDKKGSYYSGGAALLQGAILYFQGDSIPIVKINAGDDFQGTPISTITRGASQIRLLNLIHPDVFTIGNHEFDYGSYRLDSLFHQAHFPVISANLYNTDARKLFVKPYKILQIGGVKIGFIGLMYPDLPSVVLSKNIKNIKVLDEKRAVEKYAHLLADSVDLFVVVSHMGIEYDRKLASAINAIDVIIGGHSHTVMRKPEVVNGVLIFQAGSYGRFLGELDLWVDTQRDTIVRYQGKLLSLNSRNFTPDKKVQAVVDSLELIVGKKLDQTIAELKTDWIRRRNGESNIGNWIADAFRGYTGADVAFQNSGGIRKNLYKGPVTKRDFWEVTPFGNTLLIFKATGEELLSIIENSVSGKHGVQQISGMKVFYNPDAPANHRVKKLIVNGKSVDAKKEYTVATLNFVFDKFVKDYHLIPENRPVKRFNKLDRDVLIEMAQKQKTLFSRVEHRYEKVKE